MDRITKKGLLFSGFTVIELIVTVAIIGLVATIAMPDFMAWRANTNLRTAAGRLYSDLQKAKFHAIKSKNVCTVVFNQEIDGVTYSYVILDDPAIGNADVLKYQTGKTVIAKVKFSDFKGVLLDTDKKGAGITFTANDLGKPVVAFRPNGLTRNNTGGFGAGSVFMKNNRTDRKMQVTLSQAGFIRVATY